MIVQSFGSLHALTTPSSTWAHGSSGGGSLNLYGAERSTYVAIYRTQPNVRTVVDFLARNVAQLGLGVFRRVSDTDRVRLADHELAQWVQHPNPGTTRYRLIEALMQDLGIYFNAYWLKVRSAPLGLVRLPPDQMSVVGTLMPTAFLWTLPNGEQKPFDPSEIVYFNGSSGHGVDGGVMGLSPLETLRRVLAEEAAAGAYRQQMWGNSARVEGVIERPKDAPKWTATQSQSWREQWQGAYAAGGSRPGSVAVLEDGMQFKAISHTAKDSEYLAARKLSREECAAAYHVPLPMVGILEHATFSNIKEQHKHLYQDCLGPWLVMIEEEIERQLLIECTDQTDVYTEFNIAEKLKGSFEEQAASLNVLIGRPIMTANEGRARLNLPQHDDPTADDLAAQQGGPASTSSPADTQPAADTVPPNPTGAAVDVEPVLQATRDRQQARLAKLPVVDRPAAFVADLDRWNRELSADLAAVTGTDEPARAAAINAATLAQLEADAMHARIVALEQRPDPLPPHVEIHQAPITVNVPPSGKAITLTRDESGAVVGAEVVSVG